MKRTVKLGTRFRHINADGNCLWEVTEARGRGTWIAEIVKGECYAGTTRAFTTEEILYAVEMDAFWKQTSHESKDFFASLKPNQIVHYHNGFGQFVRCKVTEEHELLPIALVGNWRPYDLPRYLDDGTIYYGYHADQIRKGSTMTPHASNIYEFSGFSRKKEFKDPSSLTPISLEVPPMTTQEEVRAKKFQKINQIARLLNCGIQDPDATLCAIRDVLADGN